MCIYANAKRIKDFTFHTSKGIWDIGKKIGIREMRAKMKGIGEMRAEMKGIREMKGPV